MTRRLGYGITGRTLVEALSDGLIEDIVAHYTGRPIGCDSSILIEPLHGQARRVPLEDTAWNRRDPGYNVSVLGHWRDPRHRRR